MMFDHVCFEVSDLKKSKEFYMPILELLGFKVWAEGDGYIGFGTDQRPHFWINQAEGNEITKFAHVAFPATNRNLVDRFYELAMSQGGKSEGEPGLRPEYHPNYYGAFVLDFDGNNIEAVCHSAEV